MVDRSTFERRRQSFGAAAGLYDQARPTYPVEAIRWMFGETPLRVVDLGAGTGIFSRLVAGLGHEVTAVEPDPGMRAKLEESSPGIVALVGSAESIPLPDAAADAVVAAQAFHWFDNDDARSEIARVLVPGGIFGPIWNIRDESVGWVAELTRIIAAGTGVSASRHSSAARDFGPRFGSPERAEFHHAVTQTAESLADVVHSRSAYLVAEPVERQRIDAGVRALVRDLHEPFELPYVTVAFRAPRLD